VIASSTSRRVTYVLGIVAALLAWAAALIRYVRTGEVALGILAAGLLCLVLAWSSRNKGHQ
jgi:hypothetical protein